MRIANLDKADKHILSKCLSDLDLMPSRQGQIVIHISPEGGVGSIEVQTVFK